jgi:two-component system chemotaxis response regulator CheY
VTNICESERLGNSIQVSQTQLFDANQPKSEKHTMKVLVADDSFVMRKIIIRSLKAVGVSDIVEATNGQEAIDAHKTSPVDLILTDWNMPEKSGLEVVTEIRALGSQVPIIMVTTGAQKGQWITAIQAGVDDYLIKPFEADDLQAKLDKFVPV